MSILFIARITWTAPELYSPTQALGIISWICSLAKAKGGLLHQRTVRVQIF